MKKFRVTATVKYSVTFDYEFESDQLEEGSGPDEILAVVEERLTEKSVDELYHPDEIDIEDLVEIT